MYRKFIKLMIVSAFILTQFGGHSAYAGETDDLIQMLNQLRVSKGRQALQVSPKLTKAAQLHAQDMVKKRYFSHTGKNGSTVGKRVKKQGYKYCHVSENIASGQKTPAKVLADWQASSGHKKNNLSKKPAHVGAGFAGGEVWVLVFARPC